MNEAIKMQISAFVDGELEENESELLLRRLCQDPVLRGQVETYLAIGRAIRGDRDVRGMERLRASLAAQVGEDVVPSNTPIDEPSVNLLRPIAGVGVAATVAVVALIGLRQLDTGGDPSPRGLEDLSAVAIDGGPSYTEPPVADSMSDRPSDMLTQYYLRHGRQSPNLGSRLVGLEVRQDQLNSTDRAEFETVLDTPAEPMTVETEEDRATAQ